jgi:hypothetical protein
LNGKVLRRHPSREQMARVKKRWATYLRIVFWTSSGEHWKPCTYLWSRTPETTSMALQGATYARTLTFKF